MIKIRKGIVRKIISDNGKIVIIEVMYEGKIEKAINYNYLCGKVMKNDIVYMNTSANFLNLNTGGYNFVIINETRGSNIDISNIGHIMKLRYTPYQIKCYCPSEQKSIYHEIIKSFKDLRGAVVITGELHSMLAPTVCTLKYLNKSIKITYIMTDGGSLPIDLSFSVNELKSKGLIDSTITVGNAFGGDLEAVNIYDALIYANVVLECDVAIITMGPGITGTGTKYGFSGIEQGYIIDSINTLKGIPVFIPRISFKDSRKRHFGISHHTITVLSEITKTPARVVLPLLESEKTEYIKFQINKFELEKKHIINYIDSDVVFKAMKNYEITANTMGRGLKEDKDFFITCGSAANYTTNLLMNRFS